jgi:GrpB-like predicted nucleotidyltransferase (UPF0157 family)
MSDAAAEYLVPRERVERIVLVPADPRWPEAYAVQAAAIGSALGDVLLELHHVGSTSVPGLSAKPILDIVLVVADPTDESRYVPALEATGFVLHVRERDWHEHRLLKKGTHDVPPADGTPRVNLHVFGEGCEEVGRMLAFRDRLRTDDEDRALYERSKQTLVERRWQHVQQYADAKSAIVADIMSRAQPATPS